MRIRCFKITITILFFALILRLVDISVFKGEYLKNEAFLQQTDHINGYVYDKNFRVLSDKTNSLSHILGYRWNGGASGIEKALMENQLYEQGLKDVFGNNVDTADYNGVMLTIDYNIQKIAEEALYKNKVVGCSIVVDVKTGGIVALASSPDFDRNNAEKYYNSDKGELINRALCSYNVGSVFKIVTSAAAMETNQSYEYVFNCQGKTQIGNTTFVCNKKDGHGELTFTQGFAHSCNCLFYNLGMETGYDNIRKYAIDFGFGEEVLRINGFMESKGNIPLNDNITSGDVANISIGQGEIMATPLQVADLMCTIANDGIRKQLMLIGGIVDENGNLHNIMSVDTGRIISVDTARNLKQMLKEAVEYGTGVNAKIDGVDTSGKTATAETGWMKKGEILTHGWFAGYFPSDKPQYVCVVLCEGGNYGSVSAAPIFKEIGEKILDL